MAPWNGGYPVHLLSERYTSQKCILLLLQGEGHALDDPPGRLYQMAQRSRYWVLCIRTNPLEWGICWCKALGLSSHVWSARLQVAHNFGFL